jgi:hypothetical protein
MSLTTSLCHLCNKEIVSLPHKCGLFGHGKMCQLCKAELKMGQMHTCPGWPVYKELAIYRWLGDHQDEEADDRGNEMMVDAVCELIHEFVRHRRPSLVCEFVDKIYGCKLWTLDDMKVFKALLNDDYFVDTSTLVSIRPQE